ncbi:MAG: AAA family ATPase [Paludibacteraceae bacterium]|nr:AAA family ATPase [Paludibacteraceae bacterium]
MATIGAYELAELYANNTNRCMFITGKAGTGKTTFLKHLRDTTTKNIAVVAPTGVAAINAEGVTIHSFFQLPTRPFPPTQEAYRLLFAEQRIRNRKRRLFKNLEILIIDEISMVRADVLDAIDAVLQHYRNRRQPFGGVQVIMFGDLFQLSPVVRSGEEEQLMRTYYQGPYFFNSLVMQNNSIIYIEFDHIYRQQNQQFVDILNEVRNNHLSPQSKELLNTRYIPDYQNTDSDFHITLTTHNNIANSINEKQLDKLQTQTFQFEARIKDIFPENIYPADQNLEVKVGARVMFIKNDDSPEKRYYNGKIGIVSEIDEEEGIITVECGSEVIQTARTTWENIRYQEDIETGKIEEETLGSFTQFPLRLAWAITIHKSQGLTFDNVIIDAANAFAAGQVYVALSRCRSLEGIVLTSSLDNVRLTNDNSVIEYTQNQPDIEQTRQQFALSKAQYKLNLLIEIYDLKQANHVIDQMIDLVTNAKSFNSISIKFLHSLSDSITQHIATTEKFQRQLAQIIISDKPDDDFLTQRLTAAANYFKPILEQFILKLRTMPCRTKNQQDAKDFGELLIELYIMVLKKIHLMTVTAQSPNIPDYFKGRESFQAPEFQLIEEKKTKKNTKKTTKKNTQNE